MKKNPAEREAPLTLRQRAEEVQGKMPPAAPETAGAEELSHELNMHRIELAQQNEDLRASGEALLESHARYADLFDTAPVGYFVIDKEGVVLEVNHTGTALLGKEKAHVLGTNLSRYVMREDQDAWYLFRRKMAASNTGAEVEIRFTGPGAVPLPALLKGFPSGGPEVERAEFRIAVMDITERKKAQEALFESELRERERVAELSTILDSIPMPVFIVHDKEGTHITGNRAAEELLRQPCGAEASLSAPSETRPRHFKAMKDGRELGTEELPAQRAARGLLVEHFEFNLAFNDGEIRHVLGYGTPLRTRDGLPRGAVHVLVDITERKKAEEALRESEERFRAMAEASPVGVGVIGVPEAKFLYVNMAYIKSFGYAEADLIGQGTPQIYWNLADRDKILDLLKKNGSVADYEVRLKRKDGTPFWALSSVRPVTYDNRPALLGAFVDITERKRTEEKIVRLNHTLSALGKSSQAMMRAKNEEAYLNEVCGIIVKECGYKMMWIGFAENDAKKTVTPVASAGFEEGYLQKLDVTWDDNERGRGPTGTAIRTGRVSKCANMLTDPAFAPWRDEAIRRGYASSIVFPLMGRERAFGAISIYSAEPDQFSEVEELLGELSRDLSQGVLALRLREARNRAEELLRAERNFSKAVVQTTGGLIVGLDAAGRIQLFNHACEKTTGYTFNEIKGRAFWDFLLIPEERERVRKVFEGIKNGSVSAEMEFENYWVSKDGARRYIKWANSAIRNNEGGVSLIIGTGIDITERLLAETELKKQAGELKIINEDLTLFNNAVVNRELRMVELKKELNEACVRLGEAPRYPLVIDEDDDTKVLEWARNQGAVGTAPADNDRTS